jgi:hypothetical protein
MTRKEGTSELIYKDESYAINQPILISELLASFRVFSGPNVNSLKF